MGGHGVNGFRPRTVERAAGALVEVYDSEEVQAQLDQSTKLSTRLRFWHNAKLGLGGLGLFASAYSANAAFKALGRENGLTFANSLDAGGKVLGLGVGGSAMLKRAYYEKQRDLALSRRDKAAAEQSDALARSFERRAILAAAAVAAMIAIKDAGNAISAEEGKAAAISAASASVQAVAASIGGLQFAGKINAEFLEKWGVSRLLALRGAAAVARIGSGPIGWTLLVLEGAYTVLRTWHDKVADEQKITDWVARSMWGTGQSDKWFGDKALPPFADDMEEQREFYRLFQQPRIETDIDELKALQAATPLGMIVNDGLPDGLRAITVALPGWQPQISHYKVTQQQAAKLGELHAGSRTYDDPALIKLIGGVGYLTLNTNTLIGKTAVEYRPNGFTDPDYVLTEGNWL